MRKWPVLGMLPGLIHNRKRIHEHLCQILKQSNTHTVSIDGALFTDTDYVLTSNPADVNHILNKNFSNYNKRPKFSVITELLGEYGIFNAADGWWKFQRKILHSIMQQRRYISTVEKLMTRKLETSLIKVLDHVSESDLVVDIQDVLQRFYFDFNCQLNLGFDPGYLSIEFPKLAYGEAFTDLESAVVTRHIVPESIWKLQKRLRIGEEKKLAQHIETCDRFLYDCIISKPESSEFDLLSAFLAEVDKSANNDEISSRVKLVSKSASFLRDLMFSIMAAGANTIPSGIVWLLWLIGNHPQVEDRILQEIKDHRIQHKPILFTTGEEVNKLVYLHAALCETMRLYPPVPINHKTSTEADVLPSGRRISPNTNILLSFYSMGRMEDIWGKDCLEFKPQRWISDDGGIIHVPSYHFSAFSAGPRNCVGKNMSFLQMKIIATAIIWNYRIQVVENHPVSQKPSMALLMEHGLKVRISKRWI